MALYNKRGGYDQLTKIQKAKKMEKRLNVWCWLLNDNHFCWLITAVRHV